MMKQFKIRASQAGTIMTGTIGLTDKQEKVYQTYKARHGNGKPLTDKMMDEYLSLKNNRENPELPKTLRSYCEQWLKEQIYGRQKRVETKYMDKGNIMEDDAIDLIADHLGLGMAFKNEDHYEDDYMTGTPDVILPNLIIDAKCSWDCFTFPLFAEEINPDYYAQGQVYMALTGKEKFSVVHVLMDTPQHLIEREAYYYCKKNGYEDLDTDIYERFVMDMTYTGIEQKYLVKTFTFDYDPSFIDELISRVKLCREYINKLNTKL